jgi:hypothetical protein
MEEKFGLKQQVGAPLRFDSFSITILGLNDLNGGLTR